MKQINILNFYYFVFSALTLLCIYLAFSRQIDCQVNANLEKSLIKFENNSKFSNIYRYENYNALEQYLNLTDKAKKFNDKNKLYCESKQINYDTVFFLLIGLVNFLIVRYFMRLIDFKETISTDISFDNVDNVFI